MVQFHPFWKCCLPNRLRILFRKRSSSNGLHILYHSCGSRSNNVNETVYLKLEPLNVPYLSGETVFHKWCWLTLNKTFSILQHFGECYQYGTVLNSIWMMSSLMAAAFTRPSQTIHLILKSGFPWLLGKHCLDMWQLAPWTMRVGSLLSLWDRNFPGPTLDFGGVHRWNLKWSPKIVPQVISFSMPNPC